MKAIVFEKYGAADVLKLKEVEKPKPVADEILIKIKAASVNTSDAIGRRGTPIIARIGNGLIKPTKKILGVAIAGVVESTGVNVKTFKPGDQVIAVTSIGGGGYAEYKCLSENEPIVLMPTNMSFEEAASMPYGVLTALPFLRDHAKIKPRDKVLIIGASGAIGTVAVQLAKHYGAIVTGVCSQANKGLVTSLGSDIVIEYDKTDFTKNKENYDIIFDTVGKSSFTICKNLLNKNGTYLLTIPTMAIVFQMIWTSILGGKKAIFAATSMRAANLKTNDLKFANGLFSMGKLGTVIDRSYAMGNIVQAHHYIETGRKRGNVVLKVA